MMPPTLTRRWLIILALALLVLAGGRLLIARNYSLHRHETLIKVPAPAPAGWTIVGVAARGPEADPDSGPDDIWLSVKLRNDSKGTLYVQGIRPGWYMIESFIRNADGMTWERQNTGVDQKLEMLAVPAGATITAGGRNTRRHVGRQMMLTFVMARSELDQRGYRVLVGDFRIPAPPAPQVK